MISILNFFKNKNSKKIDNLGKKYETEASIFLRKNGYKIIAKNFNTRYGEIDIIAKDKEYLCFIEVKGREQIDYGEPSEFVGQVKQDRIKRAVEIYIMQNKLENTPVRFDVLGICGTGGKFCFSLIKGAFEYYG